MPSVIRFRPIVTSRAVRRASLAMLLAFGIGLVASFAFARHRGARTTARLYSAAARLDALTDNALADDRRRAAIAWGYAESLRLGLESPFRLIESAGRDPRLTTEERRTVAWALLAHVIRGESHELDPAILDGLGPVDEGRVAAGEQHLRLIRAAFELSDDTRAAELGVRIAYSLAVAERLVDGSAPVLAAEAAALLADREIARREAAEVVRSSNGGDPLDEVRRRRARRGFYLERPVLLAPSAAIEHEAISVAATVLDSLRAMRPVPAGHDTIAESDRTSIAVTLAPRLYAAGAQLPSAAPLAVTVQRYLPTLRGQTPGLDHDALGRARNAEMLVGVTQAPSQASIANRARRQVVGRMLLAAAVSMRSLAQETVWFPGDSVPSIVDVTASIGVADISFDRDVPMEWRPYYLRSLADAIQDLRRVLPTLSLAGLHVRFRLHSPADSALAMHDPRTRTLHLPVFTAGGTLSHELAHDIDRQSAVGQGLAGYRSDIVARAEPRNEGGPGGRVAASLRALTEELSEIPHTPSAGGERPAEIFATRVDWFVASALARRGISSGFLSAVQDELLTGHVVHPERLRGGTRSRPLLDALQGMTTVAPFAREDADPSLETLLRWSLAGPVDRRVATQILRGDSQPWMPANPLSASVCGDIGSGRASLVWLAADSRARGWLRFRARWTADSLRPPWARATLKQAPWSETTSQQRVAALRDYILMQLVPSTELPVGLGAYAAPLALRARCAG